MKPLSKKKRVWYLGILVFLFFVIVPIVILYASGYRLTELFTVARTGGFYVGVGQSGAEVYINGNLIKKTSIFQKSVFVQDLKPNVYKISVKKEGYQSWDKELSVYPETVAESFPFLLPEKPTVVEITKNLPVGTTPTSTTSGKQTLNAEYSVVLDLFKSSIKSATSTKATTTPASVHKFSVRISGKSLLIHWMGKEEDMPSYLCENDLCKSDVVIMAPSKINYFDFFPGREDLIMYSLNNGIYVSEIDDRSIQNVQRLFVAENVEFRVRNNDTIYIKVDGKYFRLDL